MNKEELLEFHIRNNWFKISRYYNQIASKYNMSFSWGFILLNIEKEGTPSTALGPKMGMEATSLSRTLKKMESEGLIIRKEHPVDKRKSLVFLTPNGVEKRKKAKEVVIDFNETLTKKISPSKAKSFIETMTKIDNVITELLEEQK